MAFLFTGKCAIVVGASSGIGRAVALELARKGAKVALLARRLDMLQAVQDEITRLNGCAVAISCDVSDAASVNGAVQEAESTLGPADILVSSAGVYAQGKAQDLSMETIRKSMEINFFGTLQMIYAVLPGMLRRGSGNIAVITSMEGLKAMPMDGAYAATKFALNGFMESLRQDLRGTGVNTLIVMPGRTDTAMISHIDLPSYVPRIAPEQVARALITAMRHNRKEIIVPWLSGAPLFLSDFISPSLGDGFIRKLKLTGKQKTSQEEI